ncbi:MAG: hypothetical protein JOZ78_14640 [Chroococcidiopsidaceae cyanobacterium CP_BM_ER_R8_30]|nr:hypothetical protein [Chroococcidiopsidaceae cyanobacterium CP_BM_ER_R8_30]
MPKRRQSTSWYNKVCCYASQINAELALENLQQAINLNPDKYRQMAITASAFDKIRQDERFQALIRELQQKTPNTNAERFQQNLRND